MIIAALVLWYGLGGSDSGSETALHIAFSGPAFIPVTPDAIFADPLEAPECRFTSFTLELTSDTAIAPGGGLRIEQGYLFRGCPLVGPDVRYAFPDPVIDKETEPNYLSVHISGTPNRLKLVPTGQGRFSPQIEFPEGLPKGRMVSIVFGDTTKGGPGLAVPIYPLKIRFLTFIDRRGDGRYLLASGNHPEVETYASRADRLELVGPSVSYSESVRLRIVPLRGSPGLESSALPVRDFIGEVRILARKEGGDPLASVIFEKGDRFKDVEVRLPSPGLYRLFACGDGERIEGTGNPILVLDREEVVEKDPGDSSPDLAAILMERSVYWGSIQNHTALGGHAASQPEEAFRCAREEGCLDFCALTDHSSNPSFHWEALRTLPDRFDEPGRFAAFAGYEWTSGRYGHRHIILRDGGAAVACSELPTDDPFEVHAPDLASLIENVGRDPNALVVMHHTRRILEPDTPYVFGEPGAFPRQRLFEVFSWQGGSEGHEDDLLIQGRPDRTHRSGAGFTDLLKLGYRVGLTADSDQHLGLPGIAVGLRRKTGLRYGFSGLTAVCCAALDRDDLFHALEARACYGTTGARILLLFKAGDGEMGEEVRCSRDSVTLRVAAFGTAPITSCLMVADGEEVLYEEQPHSPDVRAVVRAPLKPDGAYRSFYLRLTQEDGQRAWSSPVWVKRISE